MPLPRRRSLSPCCVQAGTVSSTLPSIVGTVTLVPSSALTRGTSWVTYTSGPSRLKIGWGSTSIGMATRMDVRFCPDPASCTSIWSPVSTPGGMLMSTGPGCPPPPLKPSCIRRDVPFTDSKKLMRMGCTDTRPKNWLNMGSDAKMRSKMSGPAPPNGKPPENPPPMPPMPPKPPASSKPPPCSMRSMFSCPTRSYIRRFSGSLRTSYAFCASVNFLEASGLSLFVSGWYFLANW
mmetsp:Transcript_21499/g.59535  ORF Transcript_21499/g.59535 Transcript_21499/m.59535 type:complete len:235 (-) Transcript_21499:303-1007(-)